MYHRRVGPLPLPQPVGPLTERRERSWVLSAGSRQLSFTRIDYHATSPSYGETIVQRRGWRPTTIVGAVLAVMGGTTLLGVAISSSRASAGYRYVVSVPVPPLRKMPRPVVRPPSKAAATVPQGGAVAQSLSSVAVSPAESLASDHVIGGQEPLDPVLRPTTAGAAVDAALATGRLQQWSSPDGGERGFVVVGPPEPGTPGCRALSILTRRDGVNAVERRRECGGPDANSDAAATPTAS